MITKEQENYILQNFDKLKYQEIANTLNINVSQVAYCVLKNGVRPKRKILDLTEEQKAFILNNYLTMTYNEIGEIVGLTDKQVKGWIRNHCKDRKSKLRQFNDKYFNDITTPNQAYWLGFIYADGWITANSRHYEFAIELKREDEYILKALNEELGGNHLITQKHRKMIICDNTHESESFTSVLRVNSKEIVSGLNKNGIDFNKTKTTTIPMVSDDLFPDFLRGYIDGDGCIHRMNKNILGIHITSANKCGLEYIKKKLEKLYGITSGLYSEDVKKYKTKYRLYIFKKECVRKLLDIIYYNKDSIKLNRKYKIYQDFYGLTA